MKHITFCLLFMLAFQAAWSQNPNLDYKYAITGNLGLAFSKYPNNSSMTKFITFSGISSSFIIMGKEKNSHEVSIEQLSFVNGRSKNTTPGIRQNSFSFAPGYLYHFNFLKKSESRWIPSIGLGAVTKFYFGSSKLQADSLISPFKTSDIRLSMVVQPGVSYHLNQRIYFNLSIPITFAEASYSSNKSETLPAHKKTTFDFQAGSRYNEFGIKAGVGVKF